MRARELTARDSRAIADASLAVESDATSSGVFARGSWPKTARIAEILRKETLGGALLLLAAAAALIWANSPWSAAYESLRDAHVGPAGLHLNLSLQCVKPRN